MGKEHNNKLLQHYTGGLYSVNDVFFSQVKAKCWCVEGNSSETVKRMEELLSVWHRQIEQVLTESEQVRREADDVGPSAELQYWKSRMAKFN